MERRTFSKIIGGSAFALVLAVFPVIWPALDPSIGYMLLACCGLAFLLSVYLFVTSEEKQTEKKVAGDSFTNNGNNFGHMGNVYNGRQPFVFNDAVGRQLLASLPRSQSISVDIVGSEQAQAIGLRLIDFLRLNGFEITDVGLIGMKIPPPSGPLSFDGSKLTIAADISI